MKALRNQSLNPFSSQIVFIANIFLKQFGLSQINLYRWKQWKSFLINQNPVICGFRWKSGSRIVAQSTKRWWRLPKVLARTRGCHWAARCPRPVNIVQIKICMVVSVCPSPLHPFYPSPIRPFIPLAHHSSVF